MFGATVLGAAGSAPTAYQISNSLRFDGVDDYLSQTFGTPTNNKIYTISVYGKLGSLSAVLPTIIAPTGGGFFAIGDGTNPGVIRFNDGVSCDLLVSTSIVFRDPTAHYHFVVAVDTTQATASNRVKIYVTNQQLTSFASATYMAQNAAQNFNSAVAHNIGRRADATNYYSGYLSDIYFIDGQALTPSSFGELDSNGVWVPKAYTGSYGNNGFHLDFSDGTSTTTLGYDAAGSNDWTLSGMTRAAGVNECWMVDTPTDNFAVRTPFACSTNITLSEANLLATANTNTSTNASYGSIPIVLGQKVYFEITNKTGASQYAGVTDYNNLSPSALTASTAVLTTAINYYASTGTIEKAGVTQYTGASWTANDVIGVAVDYTSSAATVQFYKNNSAQGSAVSITPAAGVLWPMSILWSSAAAYINFGQRDFAYTPPTGFKALCTANLPAVSITNPKAHFDIDLWTGTGAAKSQANWAFKPGFLWGKIRSGADYHVLSNDVVGVDKFLKSNTTDSETTNAQTITSFDASGFSLGTSTDLNRSTYTFVGWGWKAGGTPTTDNVAGAGNVPTAGSVKIDGVNMSSALAGTIAATRLSANTTAGFSIVTYTGTGANATVAHGLGVAPKMIIARGRTGTRNWMVQHALMNASPASGYMLLNGTGAFVSNSTIWQGVAPTNTVFSLGTDSDANASGVTCVAYCFAEIPGYSKFDSYVGNGSADGPFVHCGFRPRYILIKGATYGPSAWEIYDTARGISQPIGATDLQANASSIEGASGITIGLDVTASGFKIRDTTTYLNASTYTFIYAAFAEYPFGGSNVSPSPAR